MKTRICILSFLLISALLVCGCGGGSMPGMGAPDTGDPAGPAADLGDDTTVFGESLDALGAYDGYFEEDAASVTVTCLSGTPDCYTLDGHVLTFTAVREESVYAVRGKLKGQIVIDVGDDCSFELELDGFSLVCEDANPITVLSGDEVTITAKKDFQNYIYDMREAVDDTDGTRYAGAIHSEVDLVIGGKGALTVLSENNNGIHSKNDLRVKNLTLLVACVDNALKGNDSVEITGGNTTLIASGGDGIKTTDSDLSQKGNQRGTVTLSEGTHTIYAACDGIDAAYNVVIDDPATVLNIYTDKYSRYSDTVTAVSEAGYYIRYTNQSYSYSVKYYNAEDDFMWVDAEYATAVSEGRTVYYYYAFPKMPEYSKLKFFVYSPGMQTRQEEEYAAASDYLEPNPAYDTIAVSGSGYYWTNYTTALRGGGFGGGMNGGNADKGDHSTKGIKASNEIQLCAGTVQIKSYDDAVHAEGGVTLENGETSSGNVTVLGGVLTAYSNDDGLHADGTLTVQAGTVTVSHSYEGLEGACVRIEGGNVSVIASDDGVNATATAGTGIAVLGGTLYVYCNGDGLDANSRTSYSGIVFSGGQAVVISASSGNSALDTEAGYQYTGGTVIAVMPRGGMASEATRCQNFSSVGSAVSVSLTEGHYLVVGVGSRTATVRMPCTLSAYVIVLGDKAPSVSEASSVSVTPDENGVVWN